MVQLEQPLLIAHLAQVEFQFHYGSIRTFNLTSSETDEVYFNSIMVQLERKTITGSRGKSPFQFHYGSIRTGYFAQSPC